MTISVSIFFAFILEFRLQWRQQQKKMPTLQKMHQFKSSQLNDMVRRYLTHIFNH